MLSHMLVFAGTNPAGARSKWPTWKKIIRQSNACLWTLQETKCSQPNKLKMDDFIIYEKVRNEREGGGVAIGAKIDLNPVLIEEGDDDIVAIYIDIHTSKTTQFPVHLPMGLNHVIAKLKNTSFGNIWMLLQTVHGMMGKVSTFKVT